MILIVTRTGINLIGDSHCADRPAAYGAEQGVICWLHLATVQGSLTYGYMEFSLSDTYSKI